MRKMFNKILGISKRSASPRQVGRARDSAQLEKIVVKGAEKAVRDYKEAFDILAEYDKS